jgi:hypothetical protein
MEGTCSVAEEEDDDQIFIDEEVCFAEEETNVDRETNTASTTTNTMYDEVVHAWIETLSQRGTLSPEHLVKYTRFPYHNERWILQNF